MAEPFTIRIFLPDGDPEGLRIVDRMNWTGCGVAFPREIWSKVQGRLDFQRTGVYILIGTKEDDDLPTVYVGRAETVANRINTHVVEKDFWDRGVAFTSNSGALNQAHAMWLEHSLIERARAVNQCHLDNSNSAQKVFLSPADEADTRVFFKEIIQILPLLGVRAFEIRRPVAIPLSALEATSSADADAIGNAKTLSDTAGELDTIVLPTGDPDDAGGFRKYFLNDNCWFPVRISGGMLGRIKFVAAYQSRPVSAITHYAPVAAIEPYGEDGKYKLTFLAAAQELSPIPIGNATTLRSPRYTSLRRLKTAKTIADVFAERLG
jgi:hypothetical protein